MTTTTNAELISEANKMLAENQWTSGWGVESLAERLTEALEAAEERAKEADREPTPEEREELANLIPLGFEARYGVWNVFESADRILAAGFRKTDREPSALRSHVRDLTGETDEGLTEVGGFRGERHDTTDPGSVAPPSDADLVSVSWFDCDCGFSKPCAESHLKRARVPRALLAAQEVRGRD